MTFLEEMSVGSVGLTTSGLLKETIIFVKKINLEQYDMLLFLYQWN